MGVSVAGIAFHIPSSNFDTDKVISSLLGAGLKTFSQPNDEFDIRNDTDAYIEIIENSCFLYSSKLAEPYIFNDIDDISRIYNILKQPPIIFVFCHFDSGDSYGYVIFEKGKRTRRRVFSNQKLSENGEPKAFETSWLTAKTYIENPDAPSNQQIKVFFKEGSGNVITEHYLTARLLYEGINQYFDGCPWEEHFPNSKKLFYSNLIKASTEQNDTQLNNSICYSSTLIILAGLAWIIHRRGKVTSSKE